MGSGLASIPIKELAEKEPYDLQMICPVIDCDRYSEMKLTDNMIRWAENEKAGILGYETPCTRAVGSS